MNSLPEKTPSEQHPTPIIDEILTDRELLALFVRTLRGCDFIYDVQDAVNAWYADYPDMYHDLIDEYYLLETALEEAERRPPAASDAAGGE